MQAVVIAVPAGATLARRGERFTLREGLPLRIGDARDARLRLPQGAGLLELALEAGGAVVRTVGLQARASLSGEPLSPSEVRPLRAGDTLFLEPGLALRFRDAAPVAARHFTELEARLATHPDDDATWAVYLDALVEAGQPLGDWLSHPEPAGRARQLQALAGAQQLGAVTVTWHPRGMLDAVEVTRHGMQTPPGPEWLLEQLSALPVARLLRQLDLPLFDGATSPGADALAADLLVRVAACDFSPALHRVRLGFVHGTAPWERARSAYAQLQRRAPNLAPWTDVLRMGLHGALSVVDRPVDVDCVGTDFVLNPARTDVGTGAQCLVRLVGNARAVCCTLHRSRDGQWQVHDETADVKGPGHGRNALRLNGATTSRATLSPGDVLEPVEGLRLRFDLR